MIKLLMDYGILATEKDENVYYFVNWSPLSKAERWDINAKVPAVAGLFEIYWMDETKHLRMYNVGQTHYGGLRSELRRLTDPDLTVDPEIKKLLEQKEIWYRYAPSNSKKDMEDLVWYFMTTYLAEKSTATHSGRYKKIFIKESEPDKLLWVP
jgi:hypothetical protein